MVIVNGRVRAGSQISYANGRVRAESQVSYGPQVSYATHGARRSGAGEQASRGSLVATSSTCLQNS